MDFAVQIEGEPQARWVLAVEGSQVLVDDEHGRPRWVDFAACKVVRVATPDAAKPVILVQPQTAAPKLAVPQLHIGNGKGR